MSKKIILILFVLVSLLLFSSCDKIGGVSGGGIIGSEEKQADARIEQIISAIKDKDRESLKSLFSKKALDESDDFDNGVDYLFKLLQGKVNTWERDGWSSDESIEDGKKSLMIRFSFDVKTDKDTYHFFVIDYNTDNINPDNQGVYMLELIKFTDEKDLESWQDRMRAGLYIH
ncbi:DUF5104 domain-containing protein [Clostridium sp. BNL1100]|uniref:DUF5104 domain-containing protein n=1 Tax=Clostridium sp. BNL1100 TaxID=755731 RepID=UPI00024A7E30|nr:DUF5104 domain-containing protein [Clostridium sp. BNL1100]AEY66722.1 hypothetical protein Clo1100_2556 [Clostridium sp. BNL1100]